MEILKEFIFENKPTESCHASTVLPLDDGRGPVKNKPIRLRSGRVIAPASDERNTLWVCFVDISDDDCRTWKRMRTVPTKSLRGFFMFR